MPDPLSAVTLPLYPGLGEAPNAGLHALWRKFAIKWLFAHHALNALLHVVKYCVREMDTLHRNWVKQASVQHELSYKLQSLKTSCQKNIRHVLSTSCNSLTKKMPSISSVSNPQNDRLSWYAHATTKEKVSQQNPFTMWSSTCTVMLTDAVSQQVKFGLSQFDNYLSEVKSRQTQYLWRVHLSAEQCLVTQCVTQSTFLSVTLQSVYWLWPPYGVWGGHYILPCGFLWPPYVIGQAIIFLPCSFFLSSSIFFLFLFLA